MVVEVRLYATLRRYTPASPNGVVSVEAAEGAMVVDILKRIGIDPAEIHLVMVNGTGCELETILNSGDRVGLFPPVGGG
jgi:molybdopterin synthase sulfur carrier subunit